MSFVLGQISADFGKRKEKKLWDSWKGLQQLAFFGTETQNITLPREFVCTTNYVDSGYMSLLTRNRKRTSREADRYYESCIEETHSSNSQ